MLVGLTWKTSTTCGFGNSRAPIHSAQMTPAAVSRTMGEPLCKLRLLRVSLAYYHHEQCYWILLNLNTLAE